MSDRGLSPFIKAFVYFVRTLKPSRIIGTPRAQFIGSDHLGNKYFEIKNDPNRNSKTIRYFKSVNIDDWDELPPEWNAWLRMRRLDPPTMEESMRNLQRIQKFKKSSEIISSKDIGGRGGHEPQTNFPKFHEYEQNPGSKYKPDK
ncbi:hypothetical protein DERF_001125 [Dermatophagoides farinae]|uniref:NADH dehydrogenase [ubiquinone] 1 alpha subcomplex subunit 12 n=1 Tax=Dermatophagoides farinae TaxID=6954 RepID=A0A922L8D5_DERFA|nr:hypothetical protein HUG17_4359 [Dermatophagoides farinae]KAH9527081.1 hypothetical protein DERF_001125 [Dermatophagoides farinae]